MTGGLAIGDVHPLIWALLALLVGIVALLVLRPAKAEDVPWATLRKEVDKLHDLMSQKLARDEFTAALSKVNQQLDQTVKHNDIGVLIDRVGRLEAGQAASGATLAGIAEGVGALRQHVNMLVDHHIKE